MFNMFEIIGIVTVLLAISAVSALVAGVALARADGRDLRRYMITQPYLDNQVIGRAWTFSGAKLVARRQRGTRITDVYGLRVIAVRGSWSEMSNGFRGEHLSARRLAHLTGMPERKLDETLYAAFLRGDMNIGPEEGERTYSVSDTFRTLDVDDIRSFV